MERTYVTCHMSMSLDGKIDRQFYNAPCSEKAGAYYYDIIFDLGSSMAGGRTTTCMYSQQTQIDYSQYHGQEISYEDYIVKNSKGHYCFIYDRTGKCAWNTSVTQMNGIKMQIVEVLTKQVRPEYLAHLHKIGVSYLFADSIEESLIKMKKFYDIEKLVLTDGAEINGGFLKENMIDEFSIVLQPYVEGNREKKALVDTHAVFKDTAFYFTEAKPLPDGAVHLTFKRMVTT